MYRFRYFSNGNKNASGQTFKNKAVTKQLLIVIEYFSCRDLVAGGAIEFCILRNCTWQVFMQRLIELTRGHRKPHHRVTSDGHKSATAMQMWLRFIEQFNAKSFILIDSRENSITMKLNSDASTIRYGGTFDKRLFYEKWLPCWAFYCFTVKYLFAIVLVLETL